MEYNKISQAEFAKALYDKYGEHANWRTFDGRPMPKWEVIGSSVQGHWGAVAGLVITMLEGTDQLFLPMEVALTEPEYKVVQLARTVVEGYANMPILGSNMYKLIAKLAAGVSLPMPPADAEGL